MALKIDTKLEEKLTCATKNDMRNYANFHQSTIESLKSSTFIGSFYPKQKMHGLKIYRGVMRHENKEWCENERKLDLWIQNWHEEFDNFSPDHLKLSKICTLMGSFRAKYIMFDLKKV